MLIETVLERKRAKSGVRLTVKAAVAAFVWSRLRSRFRR